MWTWYITLTCISLFNYILYALVVNEVRISKIDERDQTYQLRMRYLSLPFIFVCSYRSVFPSIYLYRLVWFDTIFNSILLARSLAFIAEMAWVIQIALAVSRISSDIQAQQVHPNNKIVCKICQFIVHLLIIFIFAAEICSFYATITTNGFWFLLEEGLWVLSFTLLTPVALFLANQILQIEKITYAPTLLRSAKTFTLMLSIILVVYISWGWSQNVPMNYHRWREEVKDNVTYYSFWDGVENAWSERNVSRDYEDWKSYLIWMTTYCKLNTIIIIIIIIYIYIILIS